MRNNDSLPDVISYSSVISACEKAEQWQNALGQLVEMRHNDSLPDIISYNSAISEFVKSGHLQHALGLLLRKRHDDSLPDVMTCSAVISACEKGENGSMHQNCVLRCDTVICCPTSSATILLSRPV